MVKIILVGDYSKEVIAHEAIPRAILLAGGGAVEEIWMPTEKVSQKALANAKPDGIWCVPGSPYKSMDGALTAIRFTREEKIPFLGTCGGFQHALIEFARNILKILDADHTESSPGATAPLISKLSCALINQSESIQIEEGSRLHRFYGADRISESYQCSYGLNPEFRSRFENSDLNFCAFSGDGTARAFELKNHPFFFGTLFQPERSASIGKAHPLISAFVSAARGRSNR